METKESKDLVWTIKISIYSITADVYAEKCHCFNRSWSIILKKKILWVMIHKFKAGKFIKLTFALDISTVKLNDVSCACIDGVR